MLCDTTQRASWCTWEGSTNPQNTSTADTQTSRIHSAPKIYQCVICRTKLCTRVLFIVCIFCTEIKQRKKKPSRLIFIQNNNYSMNKEKQRYKLQVGVWHVYCKRNQAKFNSETMFNFLSCASSTNLLYFVLFFRNVSALNICWSTSQHNGPPLPRMFHK